jgi:hypothetical protein
MVEGLRFYCEAVLWFLVAVTETMAGTAIEEP